MNLGSLLRGVAGGRRGTTATGGHGTTGTPRTGGGIGETIGRAVDGQMAGGRRRGGGGLGGALRRFTGGARF